MRRASSTADWNRSSSVAPRLCTVARMTPSASISSPGATATRAAASLGPRFAPTSTAITVRLLERRRAAVDPHVLRYRPVAEPRGAQRAGVACFADAIVLYDDADIVTGASAAETRDVLDRAAGRTHAVLSREVARAW